MKKAMCRAATRAAIRRGQLKAKSECERCYSSKGLEIHHRDYDNPLDVKWLCKRCHCHEHNDSIAAARGNGLLIAKMLKLWRKDGAYTPEEVAKDIGISMNALLCAEDGQYSMGTMMKIIRWLVDGVR